MQKLRRLAPWLALPAVAAVAFAVGTCAGGDGDEAHEHEQAGAAEGGEGEDATVYTCSMHPQVRQPEPGDCPICGMDLIPASSDGADAAEEQPDRITMSERAKTLARIRTSEVRRLEAPGVQRSLLGRIEYDETTLKTVTAWTGGRIDRLRVAVTGQRIRKGQVIATIYSPEIYSAHQDLLAAKKHSQNIGQGAVGTAKTALNAARQRLKLLGVPSGELDRMEEADSPWQHIPIRTPFGGTVIERIATEGSYISTGSALY
ncbi:MAG: efflux RND transporter periplasmic adaptor subunit, partial [Polyangiales bacterium]